MKSVDIRPLAIIASLAIAAAWAAGEPGVLWVDEYGRPTSEAAQALTYIRNVHEEGLEPADFETGDLDRQAAALQTLQVGGVRINPGLLTEAALQFDAQLTGNMLRYLEHLHMGRVDPRVMGFDLPRGRESHDFDALLRSSVQQHRLAEGVEALTPSFVQYRRLRDALKAYRLSDPSSPRVRQIELAMERLRWLPDIDGRVIVVNIPMFRLWAWDPLVKDSALDMAVVVGRARGLQTPVFSAEVTDVVFRPYWNVPASILRNEILPALRRDPSYLQRHNMEILGSGADMQVRQRPGPTNALGLVKFVFPNKYNVYMHATPAVALFQRERRDFSHGCVRVEDPVTLAHWVLQPQSQWSRAAILAAMNGETTQTIRLPEPVPVVIFYMTAAFDPADGIVRFADDIYRHDARLDAALRARSGGGE
jgi:murein L,D-transpeptidase YcbB/YkuD